MPALPFWPSGLTVKKFVCACGKRSSGVEANDKFPYNHLLDRRGACVYAVAFGL